jgi:hypothetical protein
MRAHLNGLRFWSLAGSMFLDGMTRLQIGAADQRKHPAGR